MTVSLDLLPSPLDRLDPIASLVRWWTSQMGDLVGHSAGKHVAAALVDDGGQRLPGRVAIALDDTDAFVALLTLPRGDAAAHRQAMLLRLGDLAPLDPDRLQFVGTAVRTADDGGQVYSLAMARRDRLDELEQAARRQGARHVTFFADAHEFIDLLSPAARQRQRRGLLIDAACVVLITIAAILASSVWTLRIETETQTLVAQERALRQAAIAAETTRRNAAVAAELIGHGVLDRRPGSALSTLAALNAATPDDAWWTSVRWAPDEVGLSLQAKSPTAALEALAKALPDRSVELSGQIGAVGSAPGASALDVHVRPRAAPQP